MQIPILSCLNIAEKAFAYQKCMKSKNVLVRVLTISSNTNSLISGAIILDTQSHTGFQRITGDDPTITIPVVFLLKPEADRLRAILRQQTVVRVFIQGEKGMKKLDL